MSLNSAAFLSPSWSPQFPFPITLVTFPDVSILESLWRPFSKTSNSPAALKTKILGLAKPTSVLKPSSLTCA